MQADGEEVPRRRRKGRVWEKKDLDSVVKDVVGYTAQKNEVLAYSHLESGGRGSLFLGKEGKRLCTQRWDFTKPSFLQDTLSYFYRGDLLFRRRDEHEGTAA